MSERPAEADVTAAIQTVYGMKTEAFASLLGVAGQMLVLPDDEVIAMRPPRPWR